MRTAFARAADVDGMIAYKAVSGGQFVSQRIADVHRGGVIRRLRPGVNEPVILSALGNNVWVGSAYAG